MPNGKGRQEDEEELIEAIEEDGWNHFPEPPEWVVNAAKSDGHTQNTYHGKNYVYLAVSGVHGNHVHIFSQKKSEYFETTPEEGICPECQEYVSRYDNDAYLTCHRCGWQYKPVKERLRNLF